MSEKLYTKRDTNALLALIDGAVFCKDLLEIQLYVSIFILLLMFPRKCHITLSIVQAG